MSTEYIDRMCTRYRNLVRAELPHIKDYGLNRRLSNLVDEVRKGYYGGDRDARATAYTGTMTVAKKLARLGPAAAALAGDLMYIVDELDITVSKMSGKRRHAPAKRHAPARRRTKRAGKTRPSLQRLADEVRGLMR